MRLHHPGSVRRPDLLGCRIRANPKSAPSCKIFRRILRCRRGSRLAPALNLRPQCPGQKRETAKSNRRPDEPPEQTEKCCACEQNGRPASLKLGSVRASQTGQKQHAEDPDQRQQYENHDTSATVRRAGQHARASTRRSEFQRFPVKAWQLQSDKQVAKLLTSRDVRHPHIDGHTFAIEIKQGQTLREQFAKNDPF